MPKLKPATQQARRENILDAAERCFARTGFHRTTMQDICKEAGVSPGSLYIYFESKEALIAGIVERDRQRLADELQMVGDAPDLLEALSRLGEHYTVDDPQYKRVLVAEIGVESTRNAAVRDVFLGCDRFCLDAFTRLFARVQAEGRIDKSADPAALARVIAVIGDGLLWRRAVDPDFDAKAVLPALIRMIGMLLETPGILTPGPSSPTPESTS